MTSMDKTTCNNEEKIDFICTGKSRRNSHSARSLYSRKMILQNYELRSALLMEGFVTAGSRAIFLPAIAQQAWTLRKAMEELKTKHGEMFPYIRVFPLEGADRLNHRNYPDLYYAAAEL